MACLAIRRRGVRPAPVVRRHRSMDDDEPGSRPRRYVDRGRRCGFVSVHRLAGAGCRRCHDHAAWFIPGYPRVPPHTVVARVSGGDPGDALSVRRRLFAIALVLPVFFALGVMRLIALALPAAIATTPLVAVHGFYQFVGGIALIGAASAAARHLPPVPGDALRWRAGWSFAAGIAGAFVAAVVAGSVTHIDDNLAGRLPGGPCLAAGLPRRLTHGIRIVLTNVAGRAGPSSRCASLQPETPGCSRSLAR